MDYKVYSEEALAESRRVKRPDLRAMPFRGWIDRPWRMTAGEPEREGCQLCGPQGF